MSKLLNYATIAAIALVVLATTASCQNSEQSHQGETSSGITAAIAVLQPTEGNNVSGTITFTKVDGGIEVVANVSGLSEGKHGFHIHQYGDCSASDGTSAGGHFNPSEMQHGAPTDSIRHTGDLGNLEADAEGRAVLKWIDKHMTFSGQYSIIGRGVIIHAGEDDLKSQPTGAAGARLACGVIGIDNPQ